MNHLVLPMGLEQILEPKMERLLRIIQISIQVVCLISTDWIYHYQRNYTLVKTWIDEKLESEIVLNEAGWNITTPSTLMYLKEVIEESM
jgi:hypothetical protein